MSDVSGGGMDPKQGQGHFTAGLAGGSSMFLTIGGAAAAVLTILGLADLHPQYMASISVIAIGSAMALQGLALSGHYSSLLSEGSGMGGAAEVGTGLTAEFTAGSAAIALGVLSLLGLNAAVLTPVAVVVLGSGMLIGAGVPSRLSHFASGGSGHPHLHHAANEALVASAGAEVLVGGGAVVLGIIALVGQAPIVLSLVALLAMGFVTLLTGTAFAGRIAGTWAH